MIASGGGGIPVIEKGPRLIGKEGVVDKDLAAAILAHEVAASVLLILTDVKRVQRGFGSLYPEDIERMTAAEAKALLKQGRVRRRLDGPEGAGGRQLRGGRRRARGHRRPGRRDRRRSSGGPAPRSSRADPCGSSRTTSGGSATGASAWRPWFAALRPDVLLLQETGSRRDLRRFAHDVGMRAARDPWSPLRRRVKNAVLLAESVAVHVRSSSSGSRGPGAGTRAAPWSLGRTAGADVVRAVVDALRARGRGACRAGASLVDLAAALDAGLP